ncbi:MAG TPA: hypothetical protein VF421_15770 [Niabella sp.]
MIKLILSFLLLLSLPVLVFGQSVREIVKDFDGDSIKDTARIDSDTRTIICLLSTQNYKKIQSGEIHKLNFGNTLVPTKKGFEFWNDFDRSGFRCVFEYAAKAKQMRLVQMRRIDDILSFDYGGKAKGKSSINLLTNEYVGNSYTVVQGKLKKLPTIKTKMVFPITYLETFDDTLCFEYEAKCLSLYQKGI